MKSLHAGGGSLPSVANGRLAYQINCSMCHQPGSPEASGLDLRAARSLVETGACDRVPTSGDLGIVGARVLAPGAPKLSLIAVRAGRRDLARMPTLGTTLVDARGVSVLERWIAALPGCR